MKKYDIFGLVTLRRYVTILCAVAFVGCSDSPEPETPPVVEPENPSVSLEHVKFSDTQSALNSRINHMADELLLKCVEQYGAEDNVVVSPMSVFTNLAMIVNSADVETAKSVMDALQCSDIDDLNEVCGQLMRYLPYVRRSKSFRLEIANSVWFDKTLTPEDGYVSRISDIFAADVNAVDISDPTLVSRINGWCSDKTGGLIPEIIGPSDELGLLMWISALSFEGLWSIPFDKELTSEEVFKSGAEEKTVRMMHSNIYNMSVMENSCYQSVALSLNGANTDVCLYLPKEGVPFEDLVKSIGQDEHRLRVRHCQIDLPKFKTETSMDMIPVLHSMGINLGNMRQVGFDLGNNRVLFKHKTMTEVDEDGIRGAAVSYSQMGGMPPEPEFDLESLTLTFDRPFVYKIVERDTGACLMTGYVQRID